MPQDEEKRKPERKLKPKLDRGCDELKEEFYLLRSARGVARLLEIPYGTLVYHLYVVPPERRYVTFKIPKKSVGERAIFVPGNSLKLIQKKLNQVLRCVYQPKPSVHGFVPNRSIVTNAKAHAGKRYVLNIDLKDFFPAINFGRVRGMFMALPYGLNPEVATVLAQICCHENHIPQGAPTSPIISNMICAKLDSQLQKLAKQYRCTYTRYADDITFSTTTPNFPKDLAYILVIEDSSKVFLGKALYSIIKENNFEINELKLRIQNEKEHQEVTGITVNQFPNLDRRFIRQIRAMLHAWEKFGLNKAETEFLKKYTLKKRERFEDLFIEDDFLETEKNESYFKQVIRGKIEFLGMVRGKEDAIYQKYLNQFFELNNLPNN